MSANNRLFVISNRGVVVHPCPKCDTPMKHNVSGGLHFFAGDVWDDTEEYLSCPNCGMRQEYPKAPRGHLPEVSF